MVHCSSEKSKYVSQCLVLISSENSLTYNPFQWLFVSFGCALDKNTLVAGRLMMWLQQYGIKSHSILFDDDFHIKMHENESRLKWKIGNEKLMMHSDSQLHALMIALWLNHCSMAFQNQAKWVIEMCQSRFFFITHSGTKLNLQNVGDVDFRCIERHCNKESKDRKKTWVERKTTSGVMMCFRLVRADVWFLWW